MVSARIQALALLPVFLTGCGYVGDPHPPLANIPSKVQDLAAVQRGSRIIVQFTVPERTTEGMRWKEPPQVDLRVGVAAPPFDSAAWAAQARKIPEAPQPYTIPAGDWVGKEVAIAVNVIGVNGKESGWGNFVNVPVVPEPPQPTALRADPSAEGVRLTWDGPPGEFRVFRRAREETAMARMSDVAANTWTDPSTEYGEPYRYVVLRIVKLDDRREAESEPSAEFAITPVDTFPPAAPADLRAAAGPESIELAWGRSTAPDLAAYRIYRAVDGGAWEKLADIGQIPTYSDRKVERGKSYRYAVTAIDQAGNESERSGAADAMLP